MYDLITTYVQAVLKTIPSSHVTEYDRLIQNLQQSGTHQYQAIYRNYWRLNAARLSANYYGVYFQALQAAQANPPTLENLALQLYATPTHAGGRRSLEFSFATKLLHMVNRHVPIYDSLVASFYFFQEPNRVQPLNQRVATLSAFHAFLICEYARVLRNGLLTQAIQQFRQQFQPQHFTDEKVIDSLIWAYVRLLNNGGQINRQITYR